MGSNRCRVVFDNRFKTYLPGEQITGKVDLNFSEVTKLNAVSVTFKGESHTSWREWNYNRRAYDRFSAGELYFRQIHYLQKGENGKSFEMPRGKTSYVFSLTLPPSLPSSFEGRHGHIRYTARVTLETTGFLILDENYKTAFTVVAPLDLNSTPDLKNPIRRGAEETVSFMCCVNGTVTLTGHVPMGGYVPGQRLPLVIECKNESDSTVTCVRASLDEYAEFKSKSSLGGGRRKTSKRRIKCELGGFVKPRSSRCIQQTLDIPSLSPSNLVGCSLINVNYALKICATVSGLFGELKFKIPIVIGTVPIIENLIDGAALDYASYAPSTSAFSDLPPPSYEECMFGKSLNEGEKDDEDTELTVGDTDSFVPRYPVYNFGPTAPPMSTL